MKDLKLPRRACDAFAIYTRWNHKFIFLFPKVVEKRWYVSQRICFLTINKLYRAFIVSTTHDAAVNPGLWRVRWGSPSGCLAANSTTTASRPSDSALAPCDAAPAACADAYRPLRPRRSRRRGIHPSPSTRPRKSSILCLSLEYGPLFPRGVWFCVEVR